MKSSRYLASMVLVILMMPSFSSAQQAVVSSTPVVPRLVNFSGKAVDSQGNVIAGIAGVTFAIYKDQSDGAPLWLETQNVTADSKGNYTAQLGATKPDGLPLELFSSGEARWLGVRVNGAPEQPRILLLSVPYALKAADAETIGGLPPSAFVLAAPAGSSTAAPAVESNPSSAGSAQPATAMNVTTTGGTANTISMFTTATNIQNSAISQTGSGATAKIGIGTTAPAATLDVKGGADIRGLLSLPATGTATATKGFNSEPQNFVASVFNSGTATSVAQTFLFQAEPLNNDKTTASGTLNLLYATGTASPAETGLRISSRGLITFASGQTFPGTGTVTSVGLSAPASDFTVSGSPVKTTGTLNFAWNVAPTSADTANAIVKRDGSGNFTAGTITANALNAADVALTDALSVSSSEVTPLNASSSNPGATTILGGATATSGGARGVEGFTESNSSSAYGVVGEAIASSGNPIGVYGLTLNSPNAIGVFGQNGLESTIGTNIIASAAAGGGGVWGDGGSGSTTVNWGVIGTVDAGIAGIFANNDSNYDTLATYNFASGGFPFVAGSPGGDCEVDGSGDLFCTGTKNAVVPIDGGKRKVAISAIESPQNWFEDFGSAQLNGGSAVVALDPDFIQTVNTEREYMVIPVPNGECKGLYVTSKTAASFEVRELGEGTSNIRFDYRIAALRKNYENVRFADHTNDPDPRKMMERMRGGNQQVRPAAKSPIPLAPLGPASSLRSAQTPPGP
jgi:hypothetical protein